MTMQTLNSQCRMKPYDNADDDDLMTAITTVGTKCTSHSALYVCLYFTITGLKSLSTKITKSIQNYKFIFTKHKQLTKQHVSSMKTTTKIHAFSKSETCLRV